MDRVLGRQQLAAAAESAARKRLSEYERLNGDPSYDCAQTQRGSAECRRELQKATLLLEVTRAEVRTAVQASRSLAEGTAAAERDHGHRMRELAVLDAGLSGAPLPPADAAAAEGTPAGPGSGELPAPEGPKPLRLHASGCNESQDEVSAARGSWTGPGFVLLIPESWQPLGTLAVDQGPGLGARFTPRTCSWRV